MSAERAQRFLNQLPALNQDLPCAPDVIARLFTQTSPFSTDSNENIAATIARDQGLSARVLALANSAFYGMSEPITTISRAVSLLGLDEVRSMVLIVAAAGVASSLKERGDFDLETYWRHQVLTGITAFALSQALAERSDQLGLPPLAESCECYCAGILHDIGKALTVIHRPDCWESIVHLRQSRGVSQFEAEIRFWGLDHGLIGGMTLAAWNLPPVLTEPVTWHHAPQEAPEGFRLGAEVLHVADSLAHLMDAPGDALPGPWPELLEAWELDREALLADIAERAQTPQNRALFAQLHG